MRPERQAHEQPSAVATLGWRYHHLGIPTTVPHPGEVSLPHIAFEVDDLDLLGRSEVRPDHRFAAAGAGRPGRPGPLIGGRRRA